MRHIAKFLLLPALLILISACGANKRDNQDLQKKGEDLFATYICNTCHSMDGSDMYGPTLKDIYGKEITVIRDGEEKKVTVNRQYLIRAISDPDFEKVKGFENRIMPQPRISKSDVKLLVDYLISH